MRLRKDAVLLELARVRGPHRADAWTRTSGRLPFRKSITPWRSPSNRSKTSPVRRYLWCRFAAEYPSPARLLQVVARNGSQNAVLSCAWPSAYLVESFSFCPTFLIFWPTSWVACFVLSTTFSVASFALSAPLSIVSLMFSFVEDMNFLLFVEY